MNFIDFCKYKNVSRETFEKICLYVSILAKWQQKINLISCEDLENIWLRHILDSIQLSNKIDVGQKICDVGSGNGLPGIILAITLPYNNFTLIETREKRTIFLLNIIQKLELCNVTILKGRVENLSVETDIMTARAFSKLSLLFELTKNILIKDKYLLLKGKTVKSEILEAKQNWNFDYQESNSILEDESYILEIFNVKPI